MRYPDLLIDDRGTFWLPGTPELRARLFDSPPEIDIDAYAVRNLGFVRIRHVHRSLVISLRPALIARKTFETLCEFLADSCVDRIVLQQPGKVAGIEVFLTPEDALARISHSGRQLPGEGSRPFFAQELSLSRLNATSRAGLQTRLRRWRRYHGEVKEGWRPGQKMTSRSIVTSHGKDGRAVVEHFGTGHNIYDACWTLLAIGNDLERQPDPIYGEISAESYHRVSRTGRPALELVDATISVPGRPPSRSRYERLLLPWTCRGKVLVAATSLLRSRLVVDDVM